MAVETPTELPDVDISDDSKRPYKDAPAPLMPHILEELEAGFSGGGGSGGGRPPSNGQASEWKKWPAFLFVCFYLTCLRLVYIQLTLVGANTWLEVLYMAVYISMIGVACLLTIAIYFKRLPIPSNIFEFFRMIFCAHSFMMVLCPILVAVFSMTLRYTVLLSIPLLLSMVCGLHGVRVSLLGGKNG